MSTETREPESEPTAYEPPQVTELGAFRDATLIVVDYNGHYWPD
jgi:hypothetical protein